MPMSHVSIAHLAEEGTDLLLSCTECGASVLAPIARVRARFGAKAKIEDIQASAVCKHCGSIDVTVQPVVAAATPAAA